MTHSVLKFTHPTRKNCVISLPAFRNKTPKRWLLANTIRITAFLYFILLGNTAWSVGNKPVISEHLKVNVGAKTIKVEIADTSSSRQIGLMNREFLAEDEGMLFIFDIPNLHCMWMKNTPLDLDVAFINSEGRIINIESMWAQTTDLHCAKKPAIMALEVNQGWFTKNHVMPGTKIERID